MANPGSAASQIPRDNEVVRRIEDIERSLRELGPSIAQSFSGTVAKLNDTVIYLAGLTTVSAAGVNFDTGYVPGDQVFRWFDSAPALTLQTHCPTGQLLVTVGTGECTLGPGDLSATAEISFVASAPSGWNVALGTHNSTMFFLHNVIGVPLAVIARLTGVPTDELITITVRYGIWSASTQVLASATFAQNYVIAQVLAAS